MNKALALEAAFKWGVKKPPGVFYFSRWQPPKICRYWVWVVDTVCNQGKYTWNLKKNIISFSSQSQRSAETKNVQQTATRVKVWTVLFNSILKRMTFALKRSDIFLIWRIPLWTEHCSFRIKRRAAFRREWKPRCRDLYGVGVDARSFTRPLGDFWRAVTLTFRALGTTRLNLSQQCHSIMGSTKY